jgi:hypothetical protein
MITELTKQEVIAGCRSALVLPGGSADLDDILLAGLLRRSAGILCPCSRAALRSALLESLHGLCVDLQMLADRLDRLTDDLIVAGDLLELADVTTADSDAKGTWVFAAPPSFVTRRSGSIYLCGVVPDQDSFLPAALSSRVVYEGCTRWLRPESGEDLQVVLTAEGLQDLPESVWLKAPKAETAQSVLSLFERQLSAQTPSGSVNDIQILDPAKSVGYYRGRWTGTAHYSGTFVGRRPQEFGAPLWCFVELAKGTPRRIIDLPPPSYRWRGCDAAWYLQMAIDHCRGKPQCYRYRAGDSTVRFDFYGPLPLWAQRRFMIFGKPCAPEKSLIAYEIPIQEAEQEERFLQERLWMTRDDDSKGEVGA